MSDRRRLLIVEDETTLREALAGFFAGRGMEVQSAGSVAEARERLREGSFDAFLLDVGLPDGSGLSLIGVAPPERALVITARPDPEHFERYGVQHHLAKPVDLFELAREVDDLIAA